MFTTQLYTLQMCNQLLILLHLPFKVQQLSEEAEMENALPARIKKTLMLFSLVLLW